jgi:predicted nucleic acid-binding protein
MILVDTNVLVALSNPRDGLNRRARSDLRRLVPQPMMLTQEVLTEALALVASQPGRARSRGVIEALDFQPCPTTADPRFWTEVFSWLAKYADHDPDWTDAVLAILAGRLRNCRLWTYDREFVSIWRLSGGSRIPLALNE